MNVSILGVESMTIVCSSYDEPDCEGKGRDPMRWVGDLGLMRWSPQKSQMEAAEGAGPDPGQAGSTSL